jgi:hypothetical protein
MQHLRKSGVIMLYERQLERTWKARKAEID